MVALTVISVGIFSTSRVYVSVITANGVADAREQAVAIAQREVEGMRAPDYDTVGFAATQPGFVASITEGSVVYDTVVVSSPASSPQAPSETIKGVTYEIRRDIVWAATSHSNQSFKRLIATVTWEDNGRPHTIRQDAGVYPGGLGPVGGATTTTTAPAASAPDPATGLTATVNSLDPYTQIDLTWTVGVLVPTTWELQRSSDSGLTWVNVTTSLPGGTASYSDVGLSSSTTYQFRLRGVSGSFSSSWATVSATTSTPPPSCTIGSASVTPTTVKKKSNNKLLSDLNVIVNTTGSCSGLKVEWPTAAATAPTETMTNSGSQFNGNAGKNDYNWSTGNKVIRILSSSGTQLATISLVVTN